MFSANICIPSSQLSAREIILNGFEISIVIMGHINHTFSWNETCRIINEQCPLHSRSPFYWYGLTLAQV